MLTRPAAPDGVLGCVCRFPAWVANGAPHGENEDEGCHAGLRLTALSKPDETAALFARGIGGASDDAANGIPKLTPCRNPVSARFEAELAARARIAG